MSDVVGGFQRGQIGCVSAMFLGGQALRCGHACGWHVEVACGAQKDRPIPVGFTLKREGVEYLLAYPLNPLTESCAAAGIRVMREACDVDLADRTRREVFKAGAECLLGSMRDPYVEAQNLIGGLDDMHRLTPAERVARASPRPSGCRRPYARRPCRP